MSLYFHAGSAEYLIFLVMLAHLESDGLFMCSISLCDGLFQDFFFCPLLQMKARVMSSSGPKTQNEIRKESFRLIACGRRLSHQHLFFTSNESNPRFYIYI